MTRFVTMTVQVRPHVESVEIDGHKFTSPEELWQALHSTASAAAKKVPQLARSLFVSEKQTEEWARAMAQGLPAPLSGIEYRKAPGAVAITRCLPGRGVATSSQVVKDKSLEDLGL